jgi:integrase
VALQIYQRLKTNDLWRYKAIKPAQGKRTGGLQGPFFIRPTFHVGGVRKQPWVTLDASSFDRAQAEAETRSAAFEAKAKGLTVAEAVTGGDADRITLRCAVDHFIEEKRGAGKTPGTLDDYTRQLEEFLSLLPPQIKFLDQIEETQTNRGIQKRTSSVLRDHMLKLQAKGLSKRTVHNKMEVVFFMLKEAGVNHPSKLVTVPDFGDEEEEASPYTKEDLRKLFDVMDEDEKFLFTFFLDSAARKSEVAHATWTDIYDGKFHIRSKTYKTDKGVAKTFTVKTHADRRVPLTRDLLAMIEKRKRKGAAESKWLFPNAVGNPENDNGFIRQLKRIAKKAGLICGQCQSTLTKADRYGANKRQEVVWCSDDCQVCEQHYLHRLRKTTASIWHNTGVPLRTIQKWLGHKSIETTMIYLGVQDSDELQEQINVRKY